MVEAEQDSSPEGPKRLAAAVSERRKQLRLSQEEVAAAGGPSAKTIYAIERGDETGFRPSTLSRLDRGLRWPDGTALKILRGTATDEDIAAVEVWPGLADRVGSAYRPPLGSAMRALTGQPGDDAAARFTATLDGLISEYHDRLRALLEENREPGEPEVDEVIAKIVPLVEQRKRLG